MRTLLLAIVADSPVASLYCFGLGRLASPVTRHQAALLLLLKENSKFAFLLVPVQLRPFFCLSWFVQQGFGFCYGCAHFLPGKNNLTEDRVRYREENFNVQLIISFFKERAEHLWAIPFPSQIDEGATFMRYRYWYGTGTVPSKWINIKLASNVLSTGVHVAHNFYRYVV